MSYPHVRVAAPGRIEYFRSAEEFIASADWTQREATGWIRTEGIEPRVIQTARKKLHLAGGWTRYDVNDQPILSNRVVYVLTKQYDGWGIQARFACGATASWQEAADAEPVNVVKRFLHLLKDGEISTTVRLVGYPFIVVGMSTVRRYESEASLASSLPRLIRTPVEISDVSLIQNGSQGANVCGSFGIDADMPHDAVFLIARKDADYRLAALSLLSS